MAKRFTETKIWDDPWFQDLKLEYKLFWKYLCDKCGVAGEWQINMRLARFQLGEEIDLEDAIFAFNNSKERVFISENLLIIKDFVPFQYGKINPDKVKFHKNIKEKLDSLRDRVSPTLWATSQDKEEEEDKDKDKDKEEETSGQDSIDSVDTKNKRFKKPIQNSQKGKPSVEEIKIYCIERKNSVDPQKFFDYYESKGWLIGKSPMKSWQAAVRTWEKNNFDNGYRAPAVQNKSSQACPDVEIDLDGAECHCIKNLGHPGIHEFSRDDGIGLKDIQLPEIKGVI